jgi:hypothetical protein
MQDAIELQLELSRTRIDMWLRNSAFRWRWWALLLLFLVIVFLWWKLVDKRRLGENILYTALIVLVVLILVELGEELSLWDYPVDVIPLFPPISAIDLVCLPFVYSMVYQMFRTWKGFTLASLAMAVIFCFVCEPIFVFLGIYQTITWKYYYGLPIYFTMAILTKAAVGLLYRIAGRHKKGTAL